MASSERVIELSVDETNRLRAELGLSPLRRNTGDNAGGQPLPQRTAPPGRLVSTGQPPPNDDDTVLLELSIDETNALRERLGLAPLKHANSLFQPDNATTGSIGASEAVSSNATRVLHTPAVNLMDVKATKERIERARLQRQIEHGIQTQFAHQSLGSTNDTSNSDDALVKRADAKSWAKQMLAKGAVAGKNSTAAPQPGSGAPTKKKSRINHLPRHAVVSAVYDDSDLNGLTVGHAVSDLADGSTTVLTLADTPLLKTQLDISRTNVDLNDSAEPVLENVNLVESQRVQTGLREKRQLELSGLDGRGAGWDDDEFLELDGTQAPSRSARGGSGIQSSTTTTTTTTGRDTLAATGHQRGFQIGGMEQQQQQQRDDSPNASSNLFAASNQAISLESSQSNVETASDFMTIEEDEALQSKLKKERKDGKFKKDKKKKDRKRSKRRSTTESDEDDDRPSGHTAVSQKSLIEELEQTVDFRANATRKRRRVRGIEASQYPSSKDDTAIDLPSSVDAKRTKFDQVMAKGNQRSEQAFGAIHKAAVTDIPLDEEPDDAFLNAALAKARRLNALKEMSRRKKSSADAVVAAIQQAKAEAVTSSPTTTTSSGTITFAVDETREFTRALLARSEQSEREISRRNIVKNETAIRTVQSATTEETKTNIIASVKEEEGTEEIGDIHELAKHVQVDDAGALDGAIGQTTSIGRGVGSIINLLKQTGEITRKNAGKEEMRGRAKDKRTYEDYEPLDLANVVKINEGKAHSKDKELATREVKLEYRDKHGRLLTRKEAFRDLSYQFHGYGSGKRKEEKKLEQIARERAEARMASQQVSDGIGAGTFGALKATQKASGKAFVVHKTGT